MARGKQLRIGVGLNEEFVNREAGSYEDHWLLFILCIYLVHVDDGWHTNKRSFIHIFYDIYYSLPSSSGSAFCVGGAGSCEGVKMLSVELNETSLP